MTSIPTGTFVVDPVHSEVSFSVRHSGIAKVRGRFTDFAGSFTIAEDFASSSANGTINAASASTGNERRDGHLVSQDFWNAEVNPQWTFTSTRVSGSGDEATVVGDLTINGVTREIELEVEFNGAMGTGADQKVGLSITTQLSRKDFGLTWNVALEGGGVLVGDKISVSIEVEAARESVAVA